MTSATFFRRASLALAVLTLGCGDATGPRLSEAEVGELLEAMSLVSYEGGMPGSPMMGLRASSQTFNATVNVSQTVSCPNGGSATFTGTASDDPAAGTSSALVTQSFSNCAATSSAGRVWTFNSDPAIVTDVSSTYNEATGAYSMNMTQVGGIRFESSVASGSCSISLHMTMSGDADSFSATLNGSACGRSIQQSIDVTQ